MAQQRSYFGVDLLKHILAICVIIQHIHSNSRYSDATNNKIAQVVILVQGAVLAFFLVSGYFFHLKREASIVITLSKHARRYGKRLLVPFIIFSVINAIALLAIGKTSAHGWIREILIGHGTGPQMYFLPFLFLVILVGSVVQIVGSFSRRWETGTLLFLVTVLTLTALHFRRRWLRVTATVFCRSIC